MRVVVYCLLFGFCGLMYVVRCVGCSLFVIRCCVLFVVLCCLLLFVVRHCLLFVVCVR